MNKEKVQDELKSSDPQDVVELIKKHYFKKKKVINSQTNMIVRAPRVPLADPRQLIRTGDEIPSDRRHAP